MIKKIEGIVVSEVDYKESSKIINILSPTDGVVGILARGTKKIKSNLSSVTSKLTYGYFHVNYKENGLSTLIEVDVIDCFKKIRQNIDLISYASYILELANMVYKHDNDRMIYDLLISSLKKINEGYDYEVITSILELKLLEYLGIMPVIDKCVSCGSKNEIITISSYKGGYICKKCLDNEAIVDIKTIKLLRMFYLVEIDKISKLDVSIKSKEEISRFIDDYYDRYSGLYLKTKEFLKNLKNI